MSAPEAWERYADALLQREALLWRIGGGVAPRDAAGWFVSDAEVDAILAGLPGTDGADPARARVLRDRVDPVVDAAGEEFRASLRARGRFSRLVARAGLDEPAATTLALLAAVEVAPSRQRLVAYLHDDMRLPRPTLGLLDRLGAAAAVAPDGALCRLGLADVDPEGPWSNRSVRLAARVSWFLRGDDALDESLPPEARVVRALDARRRAPAPILTLVHGADNESRLAAVAQLAPGRGLVAGPPPDDPAALAALVREAVIEGRTLVVETDAGPPAALARRIERTPEVAWVVSSARELPLAGLPDVRWREVSVTHGIAEDADWQEVLGRPSDGQRLDRQQLRLVERALAGGSSTVGQAIRRLAAGELDRLALRTRPRYQWSDLVLPRDQTRQLRELADRYRTRSLVYGPWGFTAAPSAGVVALFAGPPGTGKTMAAEVIAGDLGLDLYKVDLAGVVSKYIGETEKNLDRIFDAARAAEVVLFFDEADALFGKRSEVSDAHDRYANLEVAYLLQRLERHDGLVVLATNLQRNIDQAFTRRIAVWVDFRPPEEADRRRIWAANFPADAPASDLDLDFLARNFTIPGGTIRNAALAAAFLAATDARPIGMEDVVLGLKREFQKVGKLRTPAEFDRYYPLVADDDVEPAR